MDIGIDIGGTFTDVVCRFPDGALRQLKLPSSRANPAEVVTQAVAHMAREWGIEPAAIARFVHGTTVATNAVLERKGARVGLIASQGFRDVLEIGRGNRREIYDTVMRAQTPVFLAPRAMRREVPERLTVAGQVLVPLDEAALLRAADELVTEGAEAIAVVFLFSYLDPRHELRARELISARHAAVHVSLSCEVDPAFREYERTVVTGFDAYVKPVLSRYLEAMETKLAQAGVPSPLQMMQSRGGVCSSTVARRRPVRLFLSGPAAGAIGGAMIGKRVAAADLITVDIGGTSCDIALVCGGTPLIRAEGTIDGYPVRVAMVDVNAIGSGGGSIAWLDGSGALRVGPQSAGSEPGPVCYGRGATEPTVTDASVVLGYLDPDYFAGGALKLDPRLARAAIEQRIARPMGLAVEQAALGIHRVVNAQMTEGIRLMSINRGVDPREYALVALGGAGPLHGCALAHELRVARVIVPTRPGVLSAIGLLAAPVEHEMFVAYPRRFDEVKVDDLRQKLRALDEQCATLMRTDGIDSGRASVHYFADVCYIGQSYYLEIPIDARDPAALLDRLYADFVAAHDRVYGHSTRSPARIVNLRSVHRAGSPLELHEQTASGHDPQPKAVRPVLLPESEGPVSARVYDRAALAPGNAIDGPAILEQTDTTTLVLPGWQARCADSGDLLITYTRTGDGA